MLCISLQLIYHKLDLSNVEKSVVQRLGLLELIYGYHKALWEEFYWKGIQNWIANIIVVKKANGKCHVCFYYADLNKACLKDLILFLESIDWSPLLTTNCWFRGHVFQLQTEKDILGRQGENHSLHIQCYILLLIIFLSSAIYYYKVMTFGFNNGGAPYRHF